MNATWPANEGDSAADLVEQQTPLFKQYSAAYVYQKAEILIQD